MELKKRGRQITESDCKQLTTRLKTKELSKETMNIVNYLSQFEFIGLSRGNLQAPNPIVMNYAKRFFSKRIKPHLSKTNTEDMSLNGKLVNGDFESISRLSCTGKAKKTLKAGKLKSDKLKSGLRPTVRESHTSYSNCFKKEKTLFFKKEAGEVNLYYALCCSCGVSGYTSIKSRLTVNDLAELKPIKIYNIMNEELDSIDKKVITNMLNTYSPEDRNGPFKTNGKYVTNSKEINANIGEKTTPKEWSLRTFSEFFSDYLSEAERYIKQKTGKRVSVAKNTYTISDEPIRCEACYAVAELLKEAKISPTEWQEHLEDKFGIKKEQPKEVKTSPTEWQEQPKYRYGVMDEMPDF
ncbi:MAG: hypothetical protein KKC26_02565 [Nanoarchaeota archaeon]|nr:hypothetical protein [Nanoarchaeota archaeon]